MTIVDAWLAPETGKYMIESVRLRSFQPQGVRSRERRTAEGALGISAPPEKMISPGIFLQEIDPERRQKYVKMYEDVKAGF